MSPELFNAIKKIDKRAALWLTKKMPLLIKRGKIRINYIHTVDLSGSFIWDDTPQRWDYWRNIQSKLPKYLQ